MEKFILFLFLSSGIAISASAQKYWQQQIDYTIDVSLNDAERTLDGFIKMDYLNNSPDTLSFIWIHCWPNAFKNDRTAFSEQLLTNGRTDFYFSDKQQKGYINRLNFRVDDQECRMEDHPQYIDIVKVILPTPLPPGSHIILSTPFHVQLPYNFSRGGYTTSTDPQTGRTYTAFQITQWYPKPAVYDKYGWHPIPYLDQGEFYSEFGSYDVRITAPRSYTIAATGELQDAPDLQEIAPPFPEPTAVRKPAPVKPIHHTTKPVAHTIHKPIQKPISKPSTPVATKTLHYKQAGIHDFAWFADRRFTTGHDTLTLPSGHTVHIYSYYTPAATKAWQKSVQYIKDAVKFRSTLIGEYPYNVVTAVQTKTGSNGGMEYPTITAINTPDASPRSLDMTIEHEVGHNWFYGILATNERRYAWMDEGINTYYDARYAAARYRPDKSGAWLQNKLPSDDEKWGLDVAFAEHSDQPISTTSEEFSETNYYLTAYAKAGYWLGLLADTLGTATFDSCMHEYFRKWAFRHPYPEDFASVVDETSHRDNSRIFSLLDKKGPLTPPPHRKLKPTIFFNLNHTDQFDYINFSPALAYNEYDKFMIGVLIHNFNLPADPFQFYLAPMYATGSHQLDGAAGVKYTWYPSRSLGKIDLGINGQRFSTISGIDSNGKNITGGYYKIVPTLRLTFPKKDARSTQESFIEWKTFLIGERLLDQYVRKSTDSLYYPVLGKYHFRYLNQLSLGIHDDRVLYPYKAQLQLQQAASFYRINLTGNYFFNYEKGGGLEARVFGAKFGYIGTRSLSEDLSRFEPKLTAVRGDEDYTYSNYFIGRTEFTGAASQQIMLRDGDLKLRTDLFQGLQGRSDNWVAALNLSTTLPRQIIPAWVPLKAFFDVGTYSGAWQDNPPTSHFLYVGGLQLSLLHDIVRIYAPLVYSKDFNDQLKTVPDQNTFWKRLSFSIDIQNFNFARLLGTK